MLYNQEQRQLMIWKQKGAVKTVWSVILLLNLGAKLVRRDVHKKVSRKLNINLNTNSILENSESYMYNKK